MSSAAPSAPDVHGGMYPVLSDVRLSTSATVGTAAPVLEERTAQVAAATLSDFSESLKNLQVKKILFRLASVPIAILSVLCVLSSPVAAAATGYGLYLFLLAPMGAGACTALFIIPITVFLVIICAFLVSCTAGASAGYLAQYTWNTADYASEKAKFLKDIQGWDETQVSGFSKQYSLKYEEVKGWSRDQIEQFHEDNLKNFEKPKYYNWRDSNFDSLRPLIALYLACNEMNLDEKQSVKKIN